MRRDAFYKIAIFHLLSIFVLSGVAALSCWGCHDVSNVIKDWNCSKSEFPEKGKRMENYAYEGFVYEFVIFAVSFCFILAIHEQCKMCSKLKQLRMATMIFLGISSLATMRILQKYLSNKSDFTPVLLHFSGEDLTRDTNCDQIPNQVLTRFDYLMTVIVIQPIQLVLIVSAFVHFLVFYLEHRNQIERLPEGNRNQNERLPETVNAAPIRVEENNVSLNVQYSPRLNFWSLGAPPPPYQDLELVERTGQLDPAPAYTDSVAATTEEDTTERCTEC